MEKNLQVRRHELKYYINYADYIYAKSMLDKLMKRDSHQQSEDGYMIRSLYMDDAHDAAVEEKLAGVENRDKFRLRIYDTNQDWVKLERKRKYNNYVQKSTGVISKEDALELIHGNSDVLLKYDSSNLNSIYYDFKHKYLRPVVIVDYIRDAYMLDYNNIRITFDKHLRGSNSNLDLFDSNILTEPLQRDDVIIMEVKFNNCLPSWFKDLFSFDSAVLSAISKFTHCRMQTNQYFFTN